MVAGCSSFSLPVPETPPEQGPTANSSTATQHDGSTQELRLALATRPGSLDPLGDTNSTSVMVYQHIFQGLYEYDKETHPVPRIAASRPEISNEGTRWIVPLNSDATFQNGQPVTAKDVVYTFEIAKRQNRNGAQDDVLFEQVTTIDDRTVQFDLDGSDSGFIHTLTLRVVPRSGREPDTDAFEAQPIGSGPFEFASLENGVIRLSRWPEYWDDRHPTLDTIEFVTVSESAPRLRSLGNSAIDVVEAPTAADWSRLTNREEAYLTSSPQSAYYYLAFNCKEGPTTDQRVREAIDYLVDLDRAIDEFVEPVGERMYSPVPRPVVERWEMPLSKWRDIPHGRDLDAANDLLDAAGVPMDYPWKIIVPPDQRRRRLADLVHGGLTKVGFADVTVEHLEWGAFLSRYATGKETDYNMYLLGWRNPPFPEAFTYPLFGREMGVLGISNGTYFGAHSRRGKVAARKFAEARETIDRDTRRNLLIDGIDIVLEDRAHLPAYTMKNAFGVNAYVEDFRAVPTRERYFIFSDDTDVSISS